MFFHVQGKGENLFQICEPTRIYVYIFSQSGKDFFLQPCDMFTSKRNNKNISIMVSFDKLEINVYVMNFNLFLSFSHNTTAC